LKEKNLIESYSYGGVAYSPSLKYKVKIESNEPLCGMILRNKFDHDLVKLAIDRGTTFMDGKCVENVKILKDKAKVFLDDGTNFESQIVIGADGIRGIIAKKIGLSQSGKNVGRCIFQEYPMDSKELDRYVGENRSVYIHIRFQGIAGYGWVFPKEKHVNIGLYELNPIVGKTKVKTNLKEIYKNYFNTLKKSKIIPKDLEIGRLKGGATPLFPLKKTYSDRVIICGDAGGLINPGSGEGIFFAMTSGKIAAGVVEDALNAGDISEQFLSKYQRIWKNDFGRETQLFLRPATRWSKNSEIFVKIASKDKKLADMLLGILQCRYSIDEIKWKVICRFLFLYIKDKISGN
jgi:flavin-dependent dehydrogenase